MLEFSESDEERLLKERIIWFTTVSPKGKPHLVPLWFVFTANKFYLCTQEDSIKIRNLLQNKSVSLALEDGFHALICEGTADLLSQPFAKKIVDSFISKYEWNIEGNKSYNILIQITPRKLLKFNDIE